MSKQCQRQNVPKHHHRPTCLSITAWYKRQSPYQSPKVHLNPCNMQQNLAESERSSLNIQSSGNPAQVCLARSLPEPKCYFLHAQPRQQAYTCLQSLLLLPDISSLHTGTGNVWSPGPARPEGQEGRCYLLQVLLLSLLCSLFPTLKSVYLHSFSHGPEFVWAFWNIVTVCQWSSCSFGCILFED
jgi:hypothetical protein